jgi:hypothetical protein
LAAIAPGPLATIGQSGQLEVVDSQSFQFVADIYARNYMPETQWTLQCKTEGSNLRVISHDSQDIELVHDAMEFWVQSSAPRSRAQSLVTIRLARVGRDLGSFDTLLRLPVSIRPARHRLAGRILVMGIAALLVGLPSVLGDSSPIWLRISLAVLGATLLTTASTLLGDSTSRGPERA